MKIYIFVILLLTVLIRVITIPKPPYNEGDRIRITSKITSEPIRFNDVTRVVISQIKIYLPSYLYISMGDYLVVEGRVEKGILKNVKVVEIKKSTDPLFSFRNRLVSFYQKALPQPYTALVSGLVLGSRGNLQEGFWNKLVNSGTAHVVVASGTNVAMVAKYLFVITAVFLPRKKALLPCIITIWIYILLIGFDAPIVRAGIMATLVFWAQVTGRVTNTFSVLLMTAAVMLVINPIWVGDVGYWMSVSATAGLVLFEAKIRVYFKVLPHFLREGLSTSISAQIMLIPIFFFIFRSINILSPLINMLILWTIPLISVGGMIAGLVGIFIQPMGVLILYLLYPLMWWFVKVVESF